MKYYPDKGYEALWDLKLDVNTPPDSPERLKVVGMLNELEHFDVPENMEVVDDFIPAFEEYPAIPIRIYRLKDSGVMPLLFDIHGGGFVIGNLDKDNNRCAAFCQGVPCVVIQVAYRLAPEYVYPTQLMDCYRALTYIIDNSEKFRIDPERIGLFGSSAGGNLVAGLALYLRDKKGPDIRLQILNYPCLNFGDLTDSELLMGDNTPIVDGHGINDVMKVYLGGGNGTVPPYYAAPLLCKDLSGLPPTAIVACEYCPLRDDGIEYAQRLMKNCVPTELYVLPRVPHVYDLIPEDRTTWIQEGLFLSLRREFGR